MEFNAGNSFAFAVIIINKSPGLHIGSIDFSTCSSFFISKHIKIILEHINDLIGLEGFLNSESNSINKFI